jgi:hypothetical protein
MPSASYNEHFERNYKPAPRRHYTIQTQLRSGGWRKLRDCQFDSCDSAVAYGLKYHTDRYGARQFRVVRVTETWDREKFRFRDITEVVA